MQPAPQRASALPNRIGHSHAFEPLPLSAAWKPVSRAEILIPLVPAPDGRCAEKGCVFPAAPKGQGKCLHHYRQVSEPMVFSSHQPTRVVLERGRLGAPEAEVDTSRNRDRRQLAAIREAFLED